MEVWMFSAGLRFCQMSFECKKVWAFLKQFYANEWCFEPFRTVPVDVVVGGSSIRFGSGYSEPMSTTPQPLCFTSHYSSGELARPTGPWPCACGRVGVIMGTHVFCWLMLFCSADSDSCTSVIPGERTEKADCWCNTWKMTLQISVCLEPKTSLELSLTSCFPLPGGVT